MKTLTFKKLKFNIVVVNLVEFMFKFTKFNQNLVYNYNILLYKSNESVYLQVNKKYYNNII